MFDDKLDQVDFAIASDSWHDLDSELSRANIYVEAMTAREIQQKIAAEKQEEKLVERETAEYEEDKKAALASIGKYPKIPDEGVNAKWLSQVLRIDSHIEPTIFKVKPGQYIFAFYKLIEGEQTPLYSYQGYPFSRILEILSKQEEEIEIPRKSLYDPDNNVKARWGKREIAKAFLPEVQQDLKMYFKKYTREELNVLNFEDLKQVAMLKAETDLSGGIYHWNKAGTALVKRKGKPLTKEQQRRIYIEAIQRHDRGRTATDLEIFDTVHRAGLL